MQWIEKWMTFHSIIILLSSFAFLFTKNISLIAFSAAISFVAFFIWQYLHTKHYAFLVTPANLVTTFRLCLLLGVLFFLPQLTDFWIGGIALVILLLDGLDGYLARRFKTVSDFGAYLDMETDAAFVLSMTSILYLQGKVGFWILLLGWLRYIYFLLILFYKPKTQKESRDYFAQVIAVILMASLIGGFWLPAVIYFPALVLAGGLVVYSFGRSFFGIWELGVRD